LAGKSEGVKIVEYIVAYLVVNSSGCFPFATALVLVKVLSTPDAKRLHLPARSATLCHWYVCSSHASMCDDVLLYGPVPVLFVMVIPCQCCVVLRCRCR